MTWLTWFSFLVNSRTCTCDHQACHDDASSCLETWLAFLSLKRTLKGVLPVTGRLRLGVVGLTPSRDFTPVMHRDLDIKGTFKQASHSNKAADEKATSKTFSLVKIIIGG